MEHEDPAQTAFPVALGDVETVHDLVPTRVNDLPRVPLDIVVSVHAATGQDFRPRGSRVVPRDAIGDPIDPAPPSQWVDELGVVAERPFQQAPAQ